MDNWTQKKYFTQDYGFQTSLVWDGWDHFPGQVCEYGLVSQAASQEDERPEQAGGQEDEANTTETEHDGKQAKVQPRGLNKRAFLQNRTM